ncbi:MAG: TIGR01777 family oxidoreductase [Bdellovibrionaceae bacterium]|nr:TIGR01777 family oxidoreductase [Pseudobdellovibrionaceae bacterium]
MKILVTGATGLIGKKIVRKLLLEGHDIFALAQDPKDVFELPSSNVLKWSHTDIPNLNVFGALDAVIHLAGAGLAAQRWTSKRKKILEDSRCLGTQNLLKGLKQLPISDQPKVLITSTAVGLYGDTKNQIIDENSPHGDDFLARLCLKWEQAIDEAAGLNLRVVKMRQGVVLDLDGGFLSQMAPIVLGDGKQWISWIHMQDLLSFITLALKDDKISGAYNLTAPEPIKNKDLTKLYARSLNIPFTLFAPRFAIKLMLGEMSDVVLNSQKVIPKRLIEIGFKFSFNSCNEALKDIYFNKTWADNFFSTNQFVPIEKSEVFPFFSKAENLEVLTPPWLKFKIISKSSEDICEGMLIVYKLKIHGVPIKWKTLITKWVPEHSFEDHQLKGPYTKWHHLHLFDSVKGGTLLRDEVTYKIPGWIAGKFILKHWIQKDINMIFKYRKSKIKELGHPQ